MNAPKIVIWSRKVAAAALLPVAAVGLTACGTSGPEEGVTVEDVVEEPVEKDELDDPYAGQGQVDSFIGEEVTLSADVNEILSPISFTIAGTDDTTVDPLLIVHDLELPDLQPGQPVQVTGIVEQAFDLPTVEEERGIDLEEDLYEDWDREPYLRTTEVDTSVEAG